MQRKKLAACVSEGGVINSVSERKSCTSKIIEAAARTVGLSSAFGSQFVGNSYWAIIGTVSQKGLMFLAYMLVAKTLGAAEFGKLTLLQSTGMAFGVLAGFGMSKTSIVYVSRYLTTDKQKVARVISLAKRTVFATSLVSCVILWVFSEPIASRILSSSLLAHGLDIYAVILFLSVGLDVRIAVLSGLSSFKIIAVLNGISGLLFLIAVVVGIYAGGITTILMGMVVANLVSLIASEVALYSEVSRLNVPRATLSSSGERRAIWHYSFLALVSSLFSAPANLACNALLANQPNGQAQVGIFAVAYQIFSLLIFLPMQISRVLLPIFSGKIQSHTLDVSIIKRSTAVIFLLVAPISIPLAILSPYIMSLYGEEYANSGIVLATLMILSLLYSLQMVIGQILWAAGQLRKTIIFEAIVGTVSVVFTWLLLDYGALGLSVSRVVAYSVSLLMMLYVAVSISKKTNFSVE